MRRLSIIFVLGASALLAEAARAQEQMQLDTSGCREAWASGLERFVAIELGAAMEEKTDIAVRCVDQRVEIEVVRGGAKTERQMELAGTAEAVRSRVVALGIAGLVRELSVIEGEGEGGDERVHDDEGADEDDDANGDAHEDEDAHEDAHQNAPAHDGDDKDDDKDDVRGGREQIGIEVDVFFAPSLFSAAPSVVWGGGLRVQYLAPAPLRIALDVQAGTYASDKPIGDARLVSGSAGARLAWTRNVGASAVGVGLGQRVGMARASARASERGASERAVSGMWAGPLAFGWLDFAVAERLRLGVDAEAGVVLLPVRGRIEGDDDVAVDGAWIALSLILGAQL